MLQLTRLFLLQFQSDGSKQEDKEKMVSLFWRKVLLCEIVSEVGYTQGFLLFCFPVFFPF